jgi:ribonuclease P protein component
LTRRAEFQRAAKGRRVQQTSFTLQANRRAESDPAIGPRVGLTVTKKVGNAVVRNRIRRRLREALRRVSPLEAPPDHDYVLMAREATLTTGFVTLIGEIDRALAQVKRARPRSGATARDGASPNRDGRS